MTDMLPGGYPVTPSLEKDEASIAETIEGPFTPDIEDKKMESNVENNNDVNENTKNNNKADNSTEDNKSNITEDNNKSNITEDNNKSNITEDNNKSNITEDNNKSNITQDNKGNGTQDNKGNDTQDNNKGNGTENNNNVENNAQKEREKEKERYLDTFPLKFQPNSSTKKPADDNNLSKVTSKGSSALAGIGVNPAAILKGTGSDSPPHPFYQDESREPEPKPLDLTRDHEEQKVNEQKADHKEQKENEQRADHKEQKENEQKADHKEQKENEQKADQESHKTFDLTRDYNEQKENEERADREEQDKIKKDEKLDLSVKPAGSQEIPLPYKPGKENETKSSIDHSVDDHKQTEGAKGETVPTSKTTAVHPEGQNAVPKVTKKDKIHATIDKAVGTFKQKIGKIVKNDNLERRGTEKRTEAKKTREIAKAQKEM